MIGSGVPKEAGRIMRTQEQIAQFAFDRSDPLLAANLTMPQLKVLLVLLLQPGASGQDLTSVMRVSLATMTGIVDRLAAQGLVTRREDPRDRRVRRIDLTPSCRELIDGIVTAGMEHQRRLLQRLTVADLQTVERAADLVLRAALAEATEAPEGGRGVRAATDPGPV
jgi:DNA-binding MarR family transcriptional regulator